MMFKIRDFLEIFFEFLFYSYFFFLLHPALNSYIFQDLACKKTIKNGLFPEARSSRQYFHCAKIKSIGINPLFYRCSKKEIAEKTEQFLLVIQYKRGIPALNWLHILIRLSSSPDHLQWVVLLFLP